MFDTLEDAAEKSRPPLDRGTPIFVYGISASASSIALILGAGGGNGPAQWLSRVAWAVMFLLSLTWLIQGFTSSAPISRYDFRVRYGVLWFLLLLAGVISDISR